MADQFAFGLLLFCSIGAFLTVAKAKETVTVSVYYESLCPDSRKFFLNQLGPSYDNFATSIQLEMIPYGNAKTHGGKPGQYSFTCQHGLEECRGNMIQTCAIQILNGTKKGLDFVNCAFQQIQQEDSIQQCIKSVDVQNKVKQCADSKMGKNLEYKMGKLTESLQPMQTFIPWITFNGKGSSVINRRANEKFMEVLCEFYKAELPEPCKSQKKKLRDFYRRLVGL